MYIEIPHEHHANGRPVLQDGMVVLVNRVRCRVIGSTDTHAQLTPLTADEGVNDM